MKINAGHEKEDQMISSLNNKRFMRLSNNLKFFINTLFGEVGPFEKVYAQNAEDYIKPDFWVEVHKRKHYISMKSGRSKNVHGEPIKDLIIFLGSLGISKETLKTIVLFHYGDGTLDGSGKVRFDYKTVFRSLETRIKKANEELNRDPEIIWQFIERVMFKGVREDAQEADYIYHGDVNYGVLVSKNQIHSYIFRKKWNFYENLHIGPLLFQPHARYVDREIVSVKSRNTMDIYWPELAADLDYISRRFNAS